MHPADERVNRKVNSQLRGRRIRHHDARMAMHRAKSYQSGQAQGDQNAAVRDSTARLSLPKSERAGVWLAARLRRLD